MLWSEKSSFEFHNPPNHHNCRVRAVSSPRSASRLRNEASHQKARPGIMSHRAMSQMQVVPQKTVINGEYYRTNIFAKEYLVAINRKAQNGGGFQRSLIANTSQVVFVQDGGPPLTAKKSQHWCIHCISTSRCIHCMHTLHTQTLQYIRTRVHGSAPPKGERCRSFSFSVNVTWSHNYFCHYVAEMIREDLDVGMYILATMPALGSKLLQSEKTRETREKS